MTGIGLAARIARREMRTGLKGFRIFLACLALGVASIAAVGTLSEAVTQGLHANAKHLLGGDVSLHQQHLPLQDNVRAYLKAHTTRQSSVIEMKAMAQTDTTRTLVELKGVDDAYPLIGTVITDPPGNLTSLLKKAKISKNEVWGAIVERGLLAKLDLRVGDHVRVGQATFQIRAVIDKEPDKVSHILNFGPRFMVSTAALPDTGLVQVGSQIRYFERVILKLGQTPKAFMAALKNEFPQAGWRLQGPDTAAPGLQRFINRLSLFLTFAGLTALLVGGIGVSGAVRSYLDTKTATIATLKCLGAPSGLVFQAYVLQIFVLSLLGVIIGLVIGALLPLIAIAVIGDQLPVPPQFGIFLAPLVKAGLFGMLVSMTFALWPLAQARETPAAHLFRTNISPHSGWPSPIYVLAIITSSLILAGLVVFWAPERNFAYWFVAVSALTVGLLRIGALVIMYGAKIIPRPDYAIWRLVLTNLHRPGTSTPGVVLALGTGLSVLVAVALIQSNISRQVDRSIPEQAPAFFFIDIQPDQVQAFDKILTAIPGTSNLRRRPSLRGRIVKINGVPVDQVSIKSDVQWAITGDRALSYAQDLPKNTEITAGTWWPKSYAGPPLISFDAHLADGFGVGVGDTLTLNVLGRNIQATIGSLRKIDWRSLRFDFAILFAPGTLENAPQTHIAAVKALPRAENDIERIIGKTFPNISTLRVRDALAAASRIIQGVGAAVTATASLTVLVGIIVLAGTIAATRAGRIYDSVVFKVLGATRRQIMTAFLLEFSLLGLITGGIGALVGTLIAWAVITFIMAMKWSFFVGDVMMTVGIAILFTTGIGFIGTWRALGEKASQHLRNE